MIPNGKRRALCEKAVFVAPAYELPTLSTALLSSATVSTTTADDVSMKGMSFKPKLLGESAADELMMVSGNTPSGGLVAFPAPLLVNEPLLL